MNVVDLDRALAVALDAAKEAGGVLLSRFRSDQTVIRKERNDIATGSDLAAERTILNLLKDAFPEHSYMSEECGLVEGSVDCPYLWVIDPLDGTINYAAGLPLFSTTLALTENSQPLVGVVFDPVSDECFTAKRNGGSYLNGERVHVREVQELRDSVLSLMLTSHYSCDETDEVLALARTLAGRTRGLRVLVSIALELAYVACGRLDGVVCTKSRGIGSPAGALLVREAGGRVSDIMGGALVAESTSLLAASSGLYREFLAVVVSTRPQDCMRFDRSEGK